MKLEGLKAAHDILDGLPIAMQSQIIRGVHKNIIRRVVAPGKPTNYGVDEFIKLTVDREDKSAVLFGIESRAFWFRFLEYGTKSRKTKKGADRGVMKPKPFWGRYISSRIPNVIKDGSKRYMELIEKAILRKKKNIR